MKRKESNYDEHGWKIVVSKGKDITQIYLRSKHGHHQTQKPFYLRLSNKNLKILKDFLGES